MMARTEKRVETVLTDRHYFSYDIDKRFHGEPQNALAADGPLIVKISKSDKNIDASVPRFEGTIIFPETHLHELCVIEKSLGAEHPVGRIKYLIPSIAPVAKLKVCSSPMNQRWQFGWIQACTYIDARGVYTRDGGPNVVVARVEYEKFPQSLRTVHDGYSGRSRESLATEAAFWSADPVTVQLSECNQEITVPLCGMEYRSPLIPLSTRQGKQLELIRHNQGFYTWLVAMKKGDIGGKAVKVLHMFRWTTHLQITIDARLEKGYKANLTALNLHSPRSIVSIDDKEAWRELQYVIDQLDKGNLQQMFGELKWTKIVADSKSPCTWTEPKWKMTPIPSENKLGHHVLVTLDPGAPDGYREHLRYCVKNLAVIRGVPVSAESVAMNLVLSSKPYISLQAKVKLYGCSDSQWTVGWVQACYHSNQVGVYQDEHVVTGGREREMYRDSHLAESGVRVWYGGVPTASGLTEVRPDAAGDAEVLVTMQKSVVHRIPMCSGPKFLNALRIDASYYAWLVARSQVTGHFVRLAVVQWDEHAVATTQGSTDGKHWNVDPESCRPVARPLLAALVPMPAEVVSNAKSSNPFAEVEWLGRSGELAAVDSGGICEPGREQWAAVRAKPVAGLVPHVAALVHSGFSAPMMLRSRGDTAGPADGQHHQQARVATSQGAAVVAPPRAVGAAPSAADKSAAAVSRRLSPIGVGAGHGASAERSPPGSPKQLSSPDESRQSSGLGSPAPRSPRLASPANTPAAASPLLSGGHSPATSPATAEPHAARDAALGGLATAAAKSQSEPPTSATALPVPGGTASGPASTTAGPRSPAPANKLGRSTAAGVSGSATSTTAETKATPAAAPAIAAPAPIGAAGSTTSASAEPKSPTPTKVLGHPPAAGLPGSATSTGAESKATPSAVPAAKPVSGAAAGSTASTTADLRSPTPAKVMGQPPAAGVPGSTTITAAESKAAPSVAPAAKPVPVGAAGSTASATLDLRSPTPAKVLGQPPAAGVPGSTTSMGAEPKATLSTAPAAKPAPAGAAGSTASASAEPKSPTPTKVLGRPPAAGLPGSATSTTAESKATTSAAPTAKPAPSGAAGGPASMTVDPRGPTPVKVLGHPPASSGVPGGPTSAAAESNATPSASPPAKMTTSSTSTAVTPVGARSQPPSTAAPGSGIATPPVGSAYPGSPVTAGQQAAASEASRMITGGHGAGTPPTRTLPPTTATGHPTAAAQVSPAAIGPVASSSALLPLELPVDFFEKVSAAEPLPRGVQLQGRLTPDGTYRHYLVPVGQCLQKDSLEEYLRKYGDIVPDTRLRPRPQLNVLLRAVGIHEIP